MTETQSFEELLEFVVVPMTFVFDMLVEFLVIEVNIGDSGRVLYIRQLTGVRMAILVLASGEPFELHDVLGQGARLITKDVVHHAKLFIQVRRLHRGLNSALAAANVRVNRDEVSLDEIDHFKSDKQ